MDEMRPDLARRAMRLSYVPRWVVIPTIRSQSVAEHTFRVTVFIRTIAPMIEGLDLSKALLLALDHDTEEAVTGDLPSSTKPKMGNKEIYETVEYGVLKIADCMEALYFCHEEQALGNTALVAIQQDVYLNLVRACDRMGATLMWDKTETNRFLDKVHKRIKGLSLNRHPCMVQNNV